jgi:hypothetical protein
MTLKQIRNLEQRNDQVKAMAILTATGIGKVQGEFYTRVLNKLAAGEYFDVIFGKKDSIGT